jgi:hypothetical protein
MSILNLGGAGPSSPIKTNSKKIILGIGLIVAVLGVGSTLASTITLGTNNTREFGQGVEKTVFCGGSEQTIQVVPTSEFVNQDEGDSVGIFTIKSIAVTGIPDNCDGRDFILTAYGSSGSSENDVEGESAPNPSTPISFIDGGDTTLLNVWWLRTCPESLQSCTPPSAALSSTRDSYAGINTQVVTITPGLNSFTVNFNGNGITTDMLSKIVVETQEDVIGRDSGFTGNPHLFGL